MKRSLRALIIGYGNPSRRDDGVALHVIAALRAAWGRPSLAAQGEDGDDLGGARDSLFTQQMVPELAATLAEYDVAVFVDAALPDMEETVRVAEVPAVYQTGAISHHMEPGTLLALCRQLYGRSPRGYLVSIRGLDFNFGETLSPQTAAAVPEAVERILELLTSRERDQQP
ncbi:MAG: hydrogenase maturation protease [Anaerolineae bacterium]